METHVDSWLDEPTFSNDNERYAKFVIEYFRMPAWKINAYRPFLDQFKLFCTYEGNRFRVTGASRMGDIYLNENPDEDTGYILRVYVDNITDWSDTYGLT